MNDNTPRMVTPQEWLLERKLKLIKEIGCRELFEQLAANDMAIIAVAAGLYLGAIVASCIVGKALGV